MAEITLRAPEPGDAEALHRDLRDADRAEIIAASGPDTLGTIERGLALSEHAFTVTDDSGLVCIFGTASRGLMRLHGTPWMLGTPRLRHHTRTLIKVTRRYFDAMVEIYPVLSNYVDARHVESIRLVKACGCTVGPALPFGYEGRPFHLFTRERSHV